MSEPTTAQRKILAKAGVAMPDGSYYIRNASDLQNAIDAVGRGEPQSSHDAIRKHVIARAKALGLSDKIPGNWNPDGSLKHWVDDVEAYLAQFTGQSLEHFGVKGMKWGVRRQRGSTSSHPVAEDSARAARTAETIKKHGVAAVSSPDLQHLVNRRQLEQRHSQLNADHVSAGKKAVQDALIQVGKQQANQVAAQLVKAGAEAIAKKYGKA